MRPSQMLFQHSEYTYIQPCIHLEFGDCLHPQDTLSFSK